MDDSKPARGSTEQTSSQAPEVQATAGVATGGDHRLFPGGDPSRANVMVGMESVDQDDRTARLAGHPIQPPDRG